MDNIPPNPQEPHHDHQPSQSTTPKPPSTPTPTPTPSSDPNNPYPTTFVQADTSSFKQVVQLLTGSPETVATASTKPQPHAQAAPVPPTRAPGPKKQPFKLYERRNSLKSLILSPLIPSNSFSPRKQPEGLLSPSMLDFPSLVLSPVTPLLHDPFKGAVPLHPNSEAARWAEDRAIAEKGFYLHPSPRTTPRDGEMPRLLPLFPVTSPRASSDGAVVPGDHLS